MNGKSYKMQWVFMLGLIVGSVWPACGQMANAYLDNRLFTSSFVGHVQTYDHLPLSTEDEFILVPARIGSQEGYFVWDTGAPGLVMNIRWGRRVDTLVRGQAVDGNRLFLYKCRVDSLQFRNRTHRDIQTIGLDLRHLESLTQKNIFGLLGRDWIDHQPFLLDITRGHIHFLSDQKKMALIRQRASATSILGRYAHIPVIELWIDGIPLRFGIDTGSSRSLIDPEVLRMLDKDRQQVLSQMELKSLSQHVQQTVFVQLEEVRLTPNGAVRPAHFVVADLSTLRQHEETGLHGLLGYDFLKDWVLIIDYQDAKVFWWLQ